MLTAAIILSALALIICTPISADASYSPYGLSISLSLWFKRVQFFPKPKKKKSAKGKRNKSKYSFSERIEIALIVRNTLKRLIKRLHVGRLKLHYISAGDDPYDTLARYNAVNVLVNSVSSLIDIDYKDIEVSCDFEAEKSELIFEFHLKVLMLGMLIAVPAAGISIFKLMIKKLFERRKDEKRGKQTQRNNADNNVRYQEYG